MERNEWNEIQKHLKKTLDIGRYEHTKSVMYTAGCLAMAHGASVERAMLAGLLHDCAKCIPNEEKIRLCEKNSIFISNVEYESPYLLHAKLGAYLAEMEYGVTDPQILHAICVHTTGEPDMNVLDKILYIADYIEPGRDKAPNLEKVRELAFRDLNACMAQILTDTLTYLSCRGGAIDPATRDTYEFYRKYQEVEINHDIKRTM
ncbi:MAG: bis(5'-nucleosyl)-tetraphosphatase (symmetrical) YqeK [Lachnospiraceae bacterium]|nr:bis(5'-nucleosyl)-tetraphosphatase (symmetrical) YqeK [Lachnospiraceae bacterium]